MENLMVKNEVLEVKVEVSEVEILLSRIANLEQIIVNFKHVLEFIVKNELSCYCSDKEDDGDICPFCAAKKLLNIE
jgi:hypothetical protein